MIESATLTLEFEAEYGGEIELVWTIFQEEAILADKSGFRFDISQYIFHLLAEE